MARTGGLGKKTQHIFCDAIYISKSNQFTKTRSGQTLGTSTQNGEMRSVFTGLGFIHATVVGYIGQGEVSKRPSIPPLLMFKKMIILPRQARDKQT